MSGRSLEGASVLVTGGGSGLGAEVARALVAAGARVTISGRRAESLASVAGPLGESCRAAPGDVASATDRSAMLAAALEHGGRLDAIVHAAGNMLRRELEGIEQEELAGLFATNVVGPMLLTGLAVDELARTGGAVVYFGSVHTKRAFPGAVAYATTKGALETLAGVAAAELGPRGVRVNAVRPGGVFTELNQRSGWIDEDGARARIEALAPAHALGRIGTAAEVADAVLYLLQAEWVTGTVLTVDGGLSLGVTNV